MVSGNPPRVDVELLGSIASCFSFVAGVAVCVNACSWPCSFTLVQTLLRASVFRPMALNRLELVGGDPPLGASTLLCGLDSSAYITRTGLGATHGCWEQARPAGAVLAWTCVPADAGMPSSQCLAHVVQERMECEECGNQATALLSKRSRTLG